MYSKYKVVRKASKNKLVNRAMYGDRTKLLSWRYFGFNGVSWVQLGQEFVEVKERMLEKAIQEDVSRSKVWETLR